jgi:hypothetical protein
MSKTRIPRRFPSPATAISLVAVVIAMSGTAYAATGGTFILGRANHETSTAALADSKGTPLTLSAPAHKAPLAVNRNTMVKNLNARYLGGLTATGLAETGGEGFTPPNTSAPITSTPAVVASTGPLRPGTYYVSATAELFVVTGDGQGGCWIATGSAPDTIINLGRESLPNNIVTVGETAAVTVTAGQTLEELCDTLGGTSGSTADDAGIIAIRILSSST